MHPGILVIGCGNRYASDDAVGLHVARSLKECQLPGEVRVIEAGTPGLNLLDLWEGADRVLIVDAVRSGAPPGTVHCFDASLLPPREVMPVSSHGINVIDAVELGRILGRLPATLLIVGVEILTQEPFREGLSAAVAAAVPRARDRVLAEIAQML
ncbi:MAG: hydrogenase maturation protease [Bacillota bacterium]|nr:hydrogenase maturation protease [Bacillota bacterium]